jgi:hypothetical protein
MVNESYNVLKPVQTTRQVTETQASFENQQVVVPGPIVQQTMVNGCTGCAQTVAVQAAPRVLNQTVMVQRPVIRNIVETSYVQETITKQVPVQTCSYVNEERVEQVPVTRTEMVAEERVEPYEVRTCNYVAEERVEQIPVQTTEYVAEERVEP